MELSNPGSVVGFVVILSPLLIALVVMNYPSSAAAVLGVVMFYAGGAALFLPFLGLAIAASLIGSAVIILVFAGAIAVVERRLEILSTDARLIRSALLRIAHPEIPWPPLPADEIVYDDWRGGKHWRLRADGRWEFEEKRGKWRAPAPPA